ncbi:MAG: ribosome-associated translation inhibitor RaiA [Flavobacteriales bacterium]|nr:ribosome-associated translation inhibitor RaiA [Flavobacteriales bacterium]
MQIKVHSIHFDADTSLLEFVQEKVNKLDNFYDNIISGEVFLRLDKSDNRENKISEVKISIPGKELFAKKHGKSFEEATDETVEAIRRQILKFKGKQMDRTS